MCVSLQGDLLELSGRSADVEMLNELSYRLTLSDPVTQRLQSLNRKWAEASAHAQERCRLEARVFCPSLHMCMYSCF